MMSCVARSASVGEQDKLLIYTELFFRSGKDQIFEEEDELAGAKTRGYITKDIRMKSGNTKHNQSVR